MNTDALIKLWNITQHHRGTSGARVAAGVLLGLYNGSRFKFDLTELRLFDADNLNAAIEIIQADATQCQIEIHEWLNRISGRSDFGDRFEILAHQYRLRGRCKNYQLRIVSPESVVFEE